MMKFLQFPVYWTPEQAHDILILLDEFRESIWQNYGEDITQCCRQQDLETEEQEVTFDGFEDEDIPF